MADLIELNIVVKDNGIKQAVTTVSRLERELAKAVKRLDEGTISQKRFNEVITSAKNQYKDYAGNAGLAAINVNKFVREQKEATRATREAKAAAEAEALAKKKQAQSVREMQAALAAQKRAQEENTASLNRMRAAYDSNYAVEQRTLKLKALLRQEIANGNMTVRQAGAELLKYRQSLIAYNEVTMAATKANNRFGVITQQAGYQVGDFLVQVQSGTNPLVAFGQQATQLVGILPLLGAGFMGLSAGALVALSAGLGIAIPLVTAIGAAFMRTRGEAEDTIPPIERMSKALDDLDNFSLASFKSIENGLQGVNESVLVTLDLFEKLSQKQLLVASVEFLAGLDVFEQIQEAETILNRAGRNRPRGAEDPLALGLSIEKARQFRDLLYSISGTTREEMANSFAAVVQQMGEANLITSETTAIIQQMGQELGLVKVLQDGVREAAEATAETTDRENEATENTRVKLEGILASLGERQRLAEAYLRNGEEGLRQEERILYRQNLVNELLSDRGVLTTDQLTTLLNTINETFRLEDAVEAAKVQLEQSKIAADNLAESLRDAATAMQQMSSFGQDLDTKIAQAAAKVRALQTGTNAANASMIEGLRQEAKQRRDAAAAVAVGADQLRTINSEYEAQISKIGALQGLVDQADALSQSQKGAAKTTKLVTDEVDKLRQELEGPLVNAIGSISDAFGNFIARGLTDFKGFVKQILGSFQNMIAQMISMAVKNRIMLSLGVGGVTPAAAAAGQVAGLGSATTMLGSLGAGTGFSGIAGGSGFLGGLGNAISMPTLGGGGAGLFSIGANAAAAGGGIMATVGAALPVIGLGLALFSLFKKSNKPIIKPEDLKKVNDALDMTGQKFNTTETEAQKAAAALGKVADGFDKLTQKASFYAQNFFTEQERNQIAVTKANQELTKQFNALGIAVPSTHAEFRKLVEAQDLTTEAGRKMYNGLLDAAAAFVTVKGSADQAIEAEKQKRAAENERLAAERERLEEEKARIRMQNALTGRGDATGAIAEEIAGMSFYERAAATNDALKNIYVKLLADIRDQGRLFSDILSDVQSLNASFEAGSTSLNRFLRKTSEFALDVREGFTDLAETTLRVSTDIGLASGGVAFSTQTIKDFISGTTSRASGAAQAMGQQFLQGGGGISTEITESYRFFTDLNNFIQGPIQSAIRGLSGNLKTLNATYDELRQSEAMATAAINSARESGRMLTEQQLGYYNDLVENVSLTQQASEVAMAELARLKEVSVVIPEQAAALEAAILSNLSGGVVDTARMVQLVGTYGASLGKQIAMALANAANAGISGVMSAFGQFGSLYSSGAITKEQYKSLTNEITSFLNVAKSAGGGGGGGGGAAVNTFADAMKTFVEGVQDSIDALKGLTAEEKELGGSRKREIAYLSQIRSINETNLDQIKKSIDIVKDIDKEDYATRFDYLREVGRTINLLENIKQGSGTSSRFVYDAPRPQIGNPTSMVNPVKPQTDVATASEVRELRSEMGAALSSIAKFTRKTSETLNKFDYDGLPDSRGF